VDTQNNDNYALNINISNLLDEFKIFFAIVCNICRPYFVSSVNINQEKFEINVHLDYYKPLTDTSPCCGEKTNKKHHQYPRKWRSLNWGHFKVYLNMLQPYYKCPKCGKFFIHQVPWARKNCQYTVQFEQHTVAFAEVMSLASASKFLEESDVVISNHVHHCIKEARKEQVLSDIKYLAIDETSKEKGHSYITPFLDLLKKSNTYRKRKG
jgi:transposase